jgi:hypothetical protein
MTDIPAELTPFDKMAEYVCGWWVKNISLPSGLFQPDGFRFRFSGNLKAILHEQFLTNNPPQVVLETNPQVPNLPLAQAAIEAGMPWKFLYGSTFPFKARFFIVKKGNEFHCTFTQPYSSKKTQRFVSK